MNTISEGKYIALKRLEKTIFPTIFRGILCNVSPEKFENEIKILHSYCIKEFEGHNSPRSIMKRIDKITAGIPDLFLPNGLPNKEKFNTRHLCIIAILLFQELQEDYDLGQDDDEVHKVIAAMFELFSENEDEWNQGNYLKSITKRSRKVLNYLNDNELFVYKEAIYK